MNILFKEFGSIVLAHQQGFTDKSEHYWECLKMFKQIVEHKINDYQRKK